MHSCLKDESGFKAMIDVRELAKVPHRAQQHGSTDHQQAEHANRSCPNNVGKWIPQWLLWNYMSAAVALQRMRQDHPSGRSMWLLSMGQQRRCIIDLNEVRDGPSILE